MLVTARIEREQHPDPTVTVGLEHDELTLLGGFGIHLGPVAIPVVATLIKPEMDRRVFGSDRGRRRGG
jgi:hypothetical protein